MTTVLLGSALRALWVVVLLALGFPVQAATPMTLQLKWTHNFQFAGYYAQCSQLNASPLVNLRHHR